MSIASLTPGTTDIRQIVFGVNQALERLQNVNPTPPGNSTQQGFNINGTGSQTGSASADFAYNSIIISDDGLKLNLPGVYTYGEYVGLTVGSTNAFGPKVAIRGLVNYGAVGGKTQGDLIGVSGWAISNQPNGGASLTSSGAAGTLYGMEAIGWAFSGATNYLVVSGGEADANINTGATALHRWGWSIVGNGAVRGANTDAALHIGAATATGAFTNAIMLTNTNGQATLPTSGAVLATDGSTNTIATGIDLSPYTITGNFLKGPNGFAVTGAGNIVTSGWTPYTPAVAAGSGTITTYTASGRYQVVGKTVAFTMTINITTNGSGATSIIAALPVSANSNAICAGRENAVTGAMLQGFINSSAVTIFTYSNGYPAGSGYVLVVSGTYESV